MSSDSVFGENIKVYAEPRRLCSMEFTIPGSDAPRFPIGLALTITINDEPYPMVVDDVWVVGVRAAVKFVRPSLAAVREDGDARG